MVYGAVPLPKAVLMLPKRLPVTGFPSVILLSSSVIPKRCPTTYLTKAKPLSRSNKLLSLFRIVDEINDSGYCSGKIGFDLMLPYPQYVPAAIGVM